MVEAKNSVKCMNNFRKLSPHIANSVYAPSVYWNLSTSKLLTMEFMDGAQVNEAKKIQQLGVRPADVAKLVSLCVHCCASYSRKIKQHNINRKCNSKKVKRSKNTTQEATFSKGLLIFSMVNIF